MTFRGSRCNCVTFLTFPEVGCFLISVAVFCCGFLFLPFVFLLILLLFLPLLPIVSGSVLSRTFLPRLRIFLLQHRQAFSYMGCKLSTGPHSMMIAVSFAALLQWEVPAMERQPLAKYNHSCQEQGHLTGYHRGFPISGQCEHLRIDSGQREHRQFDSGQREHLLFEQGQYEHLLVDSAT